MIRLHHVPFSRSFRVIWMLEELGLDYEIATYSIRDGSMHNPEFGARSPAHRVPALEIDGQTIFESGAILQVLAERYPDADLGCPPGHEERARYLECIGYAETMASLVEQLNLNHVFLRDPSKASPTVIKLNTRRLEHSLRGLEQLLGDGETLLAKGFTAADAMLGFNLLAVPYYVKMDPFAVLQAYQARMEARPAYWAARARDGEQDFYDRSFYPIPAEPGRDTVA